ncbi:MAG TPA: FMN-binding protein [Burkholderiales bacterium]
MPGRLVHIVLPVAAIAAVPAAVLGAQYLTVEQAQKSAFPEADRFVPLPLRLTPQQAESVTKATGLRVRDPQLRLWIAMKDSRILGHVFVDEVLGKHEFITYALAVSPAGGVLAVEILDYRESYGGEVRDPQWLRQFAGKTASAPLKLDDDIRNISGATLSCRHVTDGVKRLLATHDLVVRAH